MITCVPRIVAFTLKNIVTKILFTCLDGWLNSSPVEISKNKAQMLKYGLSLVRNGINMDKYCAPSIHKHTGARICMHSYIATILGTLYHMFFWSLFFDSFGQLAVQAAQVWVVFWQTNLVRNLGSNFFRGPRYVLNPYCLLSDELKTNIRYITRLKYKVIFLRLPAYQFLLWNFN